MSKHKVAGKKAFKFETGTAKYRRVRQLPTPAQLNKHIRETNPVVAALLGLTKSAEASK